ncbi:hypothetical protein AB4090_06990, partial [Acidithiobacillus sp. IBUN Pt1247-S3]|uniref:hypothetical protein n=1 Tax=Acidithiobacillus sp. IBUN Pt1247-S3 TaxID=3166642 RepID=UPI0034E382AC
LGQSSFVPSTMPNTQPPDSLTPAPPSGSSLDWKKFSFALITLQQQPKKDYLERRSTALIQELVRC